MRVQKAWQEWARLKDPYVTQVVRGGLELDWIEEFDPLFPHPDFTPRWKYPLPDQPAAVKDIIQNWLTQGLLTVQR